MTPEQKKVKDFCIAANQEAPDQAKIPDLYTQDLRVQLIGEELQELDEALLVGNLTEVADALADLLYVVYGTAVACGLDMEPIFNAVHENNMTKFGPGFKVREDGKVLKSPDYKPIDLTDLVKEQE